MDEHTEEQVGVQDIPPQPAAPAGRHSRSLIQHQHPQPAARAVPCVPGEPHRDTHTKGTSAGASPLLPFPSLPGWQALKALSPWLSCQGDRASGKRAGSGSCTPRGRSFGRHKG